MSVEVEVRARPKKKRKQPEKRSRILLKRWWPYLLAVVVAGSALALNTWASDRASGGPATNRALLDKAATADALSNVSKAVERVFTYSYTDPDTTSRAASSLLTGKAAAQYQSLFGQVRQEAPRQQLALTTKVSRAGLVRLDRDGTAVVVVFLDQQSTRAGKATGTPVAAQLIVTARRSGATWRITELRAA
ncbi:hypothetical protein [Actinomadura harenae]|uniref:Mce-associated membrane protein n=1 Tax=Actinomadura harenae TaxID=2483351 RepID=A0A3M2MAV2_9ACTN|nr:hypothetical protein [Actinomadura harenae]RMI46622.1 hypothetical protein EBO15_06780 [Actinomadura harenae]